MAGIGNRDGLDRVAALAELREHAEVEADKAEREHKVDTRLLEPWTYICDVPGKNVRGILIKCFQRWMQIPEEELAQIAEVINYLHTASLLIDDIEDDSKMRRGVPVAHKVYGIPMTLNTANYVYFLALEKVHKLGSPRALSVFTEELLNLHRGQGQDIMWRDAAECPTEEEYSKMVMDKTGGLFRLAVKLMQVFSENRMDFMPMVDKLALYFQIRDDYINLASEAYMQNKSLYEDLTEGKFSFPIIHAIHSNPKDHRLLNILKQRTEDVATKAYAVEYMRGKGSFEYTRATLTRLRDEVFEEIFKLGGHAQLKGLIATLDLQLDDVGRTKSPRGADEAAAAAGSEAAAGGFTGAGAGTGSGAGGGSGAGAGAGAGVDAGADPLARKAAAEMAPRGVGKAADGSKEAAVDADSFTASAAAMGVPTGWLPGARGGEEPAEGSYLAPPPRDVRVRIDSL